MSAPKIIVVTGPESTGKTTLCQQLACHFSQPWQPEYARQYIQNLGHPYTPQHVNHIARTQVKQMQEAQNSATPLFFFDTYLEITQVWYEVVYGRCPKFVHKHMAVAPIALYLLCTPDLPWHPDPVRENGGPMRHSLYQRYQQLLTATRFNTQIISGNGLSRTTAAIDAVMQVVG
jgi:nicotinamide riboside kinase